MHHPQRFLLLAALVSLAGAGAFSVPAHAAGDAPWPAYMPQRTDSKQGREILRILNPARLRGRVHEEVVANLVRLGPDAAPALFAFVAGMLEGPEPDHSEEQQPEEGRALPDVPRDDRIVLDALGQLPRGKVVPVVAAAMLRGNIDVKLVGMRVLARAGGPQAVAAWIDALTAVDAIHLQRSYVRAPCEGSLAEILEREDEALTALAKSAATIEARLLPSVVRSLGACRRARAVDVLLALLGRDKELDLVVLAQTGRLVESLLGTLAEERLTWVRPYLGDSDWRHRREALVALGRMHDLASYGAFVAALADEQDLVGQSAQWALRRVSGQDFGAAADDWEAWNEGEIAWYEEKGAAWILALEDKDAGRVMEAARELSAHPIFRHETARALAPLLKHAKPEIAVTTAVQLGQLGSTSVLPHLVHALSSEHGALRTAAWTALQTLTGRKLPVDDPDWLVLGTP